jgi:SPP1 gp7 family putative phage head morphogenesis protein
MPLDYKELRRNYVLGLLSDEVFDNPKYKNDPSVLRLKKDIEEIVVQKIDFSQDNVNIAMIQLQAAFYAGDITKDDIEGFIKDTNYAPGFRAGSAKLWDKIDLGIIKRPEDQPATPPAGPSATPPSGPIAKPPSGTKIPEGQKITVKTEKDFEKLRTQLVLDLDKATVDGLVKSYARGQSVAMWESSKGKERVELGGPDPKEQVKYLINTLKPVHEYNDKLATMLTKRLTDQINSGTAPGVMAKGMQDTITHFMREPVQVPLKGPDGKPKLDKDGNQVVRIYSPESYANLLSRTITYSLRNRGYLDHYKAMGTGDGWISVCSADERSCPFCMDLQGKFFPWDSPQEPPAYHPFCRCRVKIHFSKDAEEGFAGPDDGKVEQPVIPATAPVTPKIQAWQDWTVDMDYQSVKSTLESDLDTKIKEVTAFESGRDYGANFKPGWDNDVWINKDLPELSKTHAAVGAYGQFLAATVEGDPSKFLGCSDEVWVAMKPQTNTLFKEVNVARIANARVNLEALKQETENGWQAIVQKGKWLPKDTPLSRIAPRSQSAFTEAELWHNLQRTNAEFHDLLNAQVRSNSFLSFPIPVGGENEEQRKAVPFTQFKEVMQEWRANQHGAAVPDDLFNDALDLTLRNWFRHADGEQWTSLSQYQSTEAHMGAMLEGLHIDPGMVKEIAPDAYEYLVKQVSTGALGEPIKKVLTFTGDLTKNLPQEIKVFKDWDELRNVVQQETGFTVSFRGQKNEGRLSGQLAGIDRKNKQFWLDRGLRTDEASQLLTGQYSRLWAEDQAKALKMKGPDAAIRAFFDWTDKEGSQVGQTELDKMLCQLNIASQTDASIKFEQMAENIEKDWASVWQRHGPRWGLKEKTTEDEMATAIEDYLLQLKNKGVDLTWAEDFGNTKFTMTRKILGKDQEVNLDNYQYWFKRDLEQQMEKLKGPEKTDVTNKWGDIYQYLKTQWWRQARETNFSGNGAQVEAAEKVAAFVTNLYKDEKTVKEMAPKCYDRFVALNKQNHYGRALGKIFDTSSASTLEDLTGKMNFALDPMGNYDDMIKEVKKVFPFAHKNTKGAYGQFHPANDLKGTLISVRSSMKGSPHARATLVHETGHGIDWMGSGTKHSCARTVADLRNNCFPNLSLPEVQDLFDTELKDTMCQVRHALAMNDVRLADSTAEAALLVEDKASPAALKRLKEAPAQVDYIKARADLLNEISDSIKSKGYSLQSYQGDGIGPVKPVTKKVQTLDEYKTAMESYAQKYANAIMDANAQKEQAQIELAAHAKVEFLNDFLTVKDRDSTTLYKSNYDVPVTIYNFDDWSEQYFKMLPIEPGLKQDIKNAVKISWMQRCEGHCWSGDYGWSGRPTERWAVFVQGLYMDPKRSAEIAPKAYKAFMENMRTNKYASVLGRLLGFRAMV